MKPPADAAAAAAAEERERRLQELSQRTLRQWPWHIDVATMLWRAERPISLFAAGVAVDGPLPVARVAAIFGVDQSRMVLDLIRWLIDTGEAFTCELVDRSTDPPRHFSVDAEAEIDGDGQVTGILGIARDITSLRWAEAASNEHRGLLERAQKIGRMGHWHLPLGHRQLFGSQALFGLLKMPVRPSAPLSQIERMIVEDQRPRVREVIRRGLRSRVPFSFVCDVGTDSGQVTLEVFGEPELDQSGQFTGLFGVVRDITEQQETSRQMARQTRMLERAQRIGQIGYWSIGALDDRFEWSPSLYELFGVEPGRRMRLPEFLQMIAPEQRQDVMARRHAAVEKLERFHYLADVIREDGSRVSIEAFGEPEFDRQGRFTGYFGVTRDVTRLRQAERLVQEQNLALERAQKVGRIGHWRMDILGERVHWSDSVYDILRLPRGTEVSSTYILDLIVPEQATAIRELRATAMAEAKPYGFVADIQTSDGAPLTVESLAEPVFDENGRLEAYFGTTQDITDRIQAERSSRENEQRLQMIFDAMDKAGIGIGVQDSQGLIEEARPAFLKIAGFDSAENVVGKRWSSMQGEGGADIQGRIAGVLGEAMAGRADKAPNMDLEWVRPDGQQVSALVRLAPLPGGSRAVIVLDQTAQRTARREIEAREYRTRAILDAIDAAGIGYCVEDIEGRIFDVSPKVRALVGLSPDADLVGRRWTSLLRVPDAVRRRFEQERDAYQKGEGEAVVYPEFELEVEGGRTIQLHARATPLPGIGRLILIIDQTERWELQQQQAVMERHLQQVQKMEAVGQLAGGVAHEINNMLHPIRTFARAATRSDDADRREHLMQRIIECADKAASIVRETLNFARSDEGDMRVQVINDLLSGVVSFSRDLPMRNIELEFALPAERLQVRLNETEFTQVMVNLLQNAIDATGDAGIVQIGLERRRFGPDNALRLNPGDHAVIHVVDRGEGMPPEIVDRAFEPFFTTKEPGKGTGLGLAVVYGIVKRWGGEIRIDSEQGVGTRIEVLLPLADAAPASAGEGE